MPPSAERCQAPAEIEAARVAEAHGADGRMSHEDNMRSIELFGRRVIPALREIAEELELAGPFDVDAPVSLAATPSEDLRPYEFSPGE